MKNPNGAFTIQNVPIKLDQKGFGKNHLYSFTIQNVPIKFGVKKPP